MRNMIWVPALMLVLFACKKPNWVRSQDAYVIGANDIFSLDKSKKSSMKDEYVRSNVLVATWLESKKVKFCSGTVIEHEQTVKIITNHHCFAQVSEQGVPDAKHLKGSCDETKVFFDFAEHSGYQYIESRCKKGTLRSDILGDLAVFELVDDLPAGVHALKIYRKPENIGAWEALDSLKGRKAKIVHHPSLKKRMKQPIGVNVKLPSASVTNSDCEIEGAFTPNKWPLDRVLPVSISHSCDLQHGSSGSSLVDAKTNMVLGINWGGLKVNKDTGAEVENGATHFIYVNNFLDETHDDYDVPEYKGDGKEYKLTDGQVKQGRIKGSDINIQPTSCGVLGKLSGIGGYLVYIFLLLPFGVVSAKEATPSEASQVEKMQVKDIHLKRMILSQLIVEEVRVLEEMIFKGNIQQKKIATEKLTKAHKKAQFLARKSIFFENYFAAMSIKDKSTVVNSEQLLFPKEIESELAAVLSLKGKQATKKDMGSLIEEVRRRESLIRSLEKGDVKRRQSLELVPLLIEARRYGAALGILAKYQGGDSSFRYFYDRLQSIYAMHHKGSGRVSIDASF